MHCMKNEVARNYNEVDYTGKTKRLHPSEPFVLRMYQSTVCS